MDNQQPNLDQQLRTTQIIAAALAAGVVVFGAVGLVIPLNAPALIEGQGIAVFLAIFGGVLFLMHLIVPAVLTPQFLRSRGAIAAEAVETEAGLFKAYQSMVIVSLGPLEGAAFANGIGFLLQRQWWSMAILGGIVLRMLVQFPTRTRLKHWIENHSSRLTNDGG